MMGGVTMKMMPDIGYPQTDEIAEPGVYACIKCEYVENDSSKPFSIILDKKQKLPKCKFCGKTYWLKV